MNVLDFLTAILALINAIQPGDTIAPEDSTYALNAANTLIDSWNAAVRKSLAANYEASLYTFVPAPAIPEDLTATLTLPNGWTRALQYNTAVEISVPFGRQIDQSVAAIAAQSRAAIITPPGTPQ